MTICCASCALRTGVFDDVDVGFEVLVDGDFDVDVGADLGSGAEEGVLCTSCSGFTLEGGTAAGDGFPFFTAIVV